MPLREMSGLYYPNKIARIYVEAMEQVMGANGLNAVLDLAGLARYIGNYPADNLNKEFDFVEFTALNEGLEEMYGPRGGRGLALRAGRACFSQGLKNFGALAGVGDMAFKVLPLQSKLKMGLPAMAAIFSQFSDQKSDVEEYQDHYRYYIRENSPVCYGRACDKPCATWLSASCKRACAGSPVGTSSASTRANASRWAPRTACSSSTRSQSPGCGVSSPGRVAPGGIRQPPRHTSPHELHCTPAVASIGGWPKGTPLADKQQILIVEDDLDLAEMLNAYFRVQGYDVLTVNEGETAVRVGIKATPDLVVLDIRLPDIDGYEVCRRLRAHRRTQDIPIIFLTERRDRMDKLQGLELGVVDYITKPFDIQELRLRVRNTLQRSGLQTLVNPVTNYAESDFVDERLNKLLYEEDWALLAVWIAGVDGFREQYGFVASDDVLRAISLMINNALRETGGEQDFVGHLGQYDFVIITAPQRLAALRERIEVRIQQSMEYFYPLKDREKAHQNMRSGGLQLVVGALTDQSGSHNTLEALKTALAHARQPVTGYPSA